ncbi:condensation domain-containing protein [Streptomyces sp. V2I9]|uniref:condensation domain-containing protein n=1 Tax=Streptomyces sp. V2I9 TaxID=3042304 RepID=UPI003593B67F
MGALARLLSAERATPFMFMLAVHHLTLARMSGQRDIVVASPMANRNNLALLKTMGYFVNIVGLRVDSESDRTFRDLLRHIRSVSRDAYENKDYPLAQLLAHLGSRREGRPTALFETMFTYENIPAEAETWSSGLEVEAIGTDEVVVKSDLSFSIVSAERGFRGAICFRTALYNREFIESLAAQFLRLVHEVVRNPEAELDELLASEAGASR